MRDDLNTLIFLGRSAPARMSKSFEVVQFTSYLFNSGKIIALKFHGPQLLTTTEVFKGKAIPVVLGIQEQIEVSGAFYVNETVIIY